MLSKYESSGNWLILIPIQQSIKTKIELKGLELKKWNVKINRGILTGLNDAFIIDEQTRNSLIIQDPNSAEIIRPILRGRDIKRYKYEFGNLYVILASYESYKFIPEKYPAIYNHLLMFETPLKSRGQCRYTSSGKTNTTKDYPGQHHWLELDNNPGPDYLNDFIKHKIVWAELARTGNSFVYDSSGYFTIAGSFILTLPSDYSSEKHYKYLVSLLNNPVTLFYLEFVYSKLDNTGWQWKKDPIEKIPLPKLSIDSVENIIVSYDELIKTNTLENLVSHNINVFNLFDLTNDEIEYIYRKLGVFSDELELFLAKI